WICGMSSNLIFVSPTSLSAQQVGPEAQATERQQLQDEVRRLREEARRLQADGKPNESLATAEKVVAAERQLSAISTDLASDLARVATRYEALENFEAARSAAQEMLNILTRLYGNEYWLVTDTRSELERIRRKSLLTVEERKEYADT